MQGGTVYLVGAGPGDPGLITARGLACIRGADVLVYDRLVSPVLVAQSRPDAGKIYVGKEVGQHGRSQADISGLIAELALAGKSVCRLKGGDPFVFGRGGEEGELLAGLGIPFAVVPGITSGVAAPAYAGIPVTHRDVAGSVTLVTGHDGVCKRGPAVDWAALAAGSGTLLIYMGIEAIGETAERLIRFGRSPETPVAVVRWGTRPEQQTVTGSLGSIAETVRQAGIRPPAMIVVGEVVALRERLAWAERRPLFGRRVLIPTLGGGGDQQGAERLRDAGAEVWEWPVAALSDPADWAPLDQALARLVCYEELLFADAEGVGRFLARLTGAGLDLRALLHTRLRAATPEAAAALRQAGLWTESALAAADGRALVVGEARAAAALAAERVRAGLLADWAATHRCQPRHDTGALLQEALLRGEIDDLWLPSAEALHLLREVAGEAPLPGEIRSQALASA